MAYLRFKAIEQMQDRVSPGVNAPSDKVSDYFGVNAYDLKAMKRTLSPELYKKIKLAIDKGKSIDPETADAIAAAVKTWAISRGATHYTHWFHPLTGATAEKHDSFFDYMSEIEEFKGGELAQQEPDASSFPSGGIRSTFEARGYTAWDPSSPMFVMANTLCIPTIFVSYTGEALDYKAPLIKTTEILDRAATAILRYFDTSITRVIPTLGCEQEYFVVDEALFAARPDLVMAGRSVFGHSPARGQQLDDHYFGSIPPRIYNYMRDFEIECHKLGIPVSTRHNEVAPSQFEVAPTFEDMNVAMDHNQLLMDVMNKVAEKHNLKVLFHEKPFSGLNGSGKHNNWSLITSNGENLLQPSSKAKDNIIFLIFFVCTIKAVWDYADLLRASIASAGNDYRLGANEAPPAIISAFLGKQLSNVLDELEKNGDIQVKKGENLYMKLGITKIPEIILDNTDRNRTSPFAFTGNKFEFRAVGASANVAAPMTILNLIVADQLQQFRKDFEQEVSKDDKRDLAVIRVLRKYIKDSKKIRFEGDGYSDEWVKEAAKRGLSNVKDTPRALDFYVNDKAKALFSKHKIFSERELEARHEILLENYIMKLQIESRVMGDLAVNHVIPTAIAYQNKLIENANGLKAVGVDNKGVVATIKEISTHIDDIKKYVDEMTEARKKANTIDDTRKKAIAYCDNVKEKYFDKIRYAVDKLELSIDDEDWPLPKYREMLFLK